MFRKLFVVAASAAVTIAVLSITTEPKVTRVDVDEPMVVEVQLNS